MSVRRPSIGEQIEQSFRIQRPCAGLETVQRFPREATIPSRFVEGHLTQFIKRRVGKPRLEDKHDFVRSFAFTLEGVLKHSHKQGRFDLGAQLLPNLPPECLQRTLAELDGAPWWPTIVLVLQNVVTMAHQEIAVPEEHADRDRANGGDRHSDYRDARALAGTCGSQSSRRTAGITTRLTKCSVG
jgi:hypothetical protein